MERGVGRRTSRQVVAYHGSYEGARRAVDHLSDEGFPVERLSIVGDGPKVEQHTAGRHGGYGRATIRGAGAGAVAGAFFGSLFGLVFVSGSVDTPVSAPTLAFWGLVFGAVLGAMVGLISHALSGGRRDFSSVGGTREGRYDVMADEEVAEDVRGMLRGLHGNLRGEGA